MNPNVIIEVSVRDPERGLKLTRTIGPNEIFSFNSTLGDPVRIWWEVLQNLGMDLDLAIYQYHFNKAGQQPPSS